MTAVINPAICASEFAILKTAIDEWNNDDSHDYDINIGGRQVKAFSRHLEETIEKFLNNTADAGKQVDPDVRETLIEIDRLAFAYEDFKRLASEESPFAPPGGSAQLWQAWRNIVEHYASRPHYPKPQTIATLLSQKVGQMQIAAIYGWVLDSGAPDIEKVTDEMANPGKHYKPETWQHPAKASKKRLVDRMWAERGPVREAKFDVRSDGEKLGKFVPPSLDEMVRVGAPSKQIADVHKISIDEAEQLLLEAGTQPMREIVPANAAVAHLERMMREQSPPPLPPSPSASPSPLSSLSQSPFPTTPVGGSKLLQEV